ncbi:hypothetical protein FQR65_LT20440 [Abscondita terminalis]|nr:hypothetical protein FQR65_LT20440 [Abscondita terminalis]
MRFKFEVQDESGAFDVYDDLTYNEVLDGYYPLPDDRSEWGIIRLTFKICGIEKTNSFNLANYSGFKVLPVAGLGDDLLHRKFTIKVKDSGCFEEDFTISLVSYISEYCSGRMWTLQIHKFVTVTRREESEGGKISGDYVLAISPKEGFNTFVTSEDIMENTLTVPITVSSDFPIVDLSKSGGAVCGGSTTGDLYIKVDNASGPVTYFLKKSTDAHFPATGQSSPVFTGLSEGSYQVKIVTRCYQIIQPFVMVNQSANNIIVGERELCKGDTLDLTPLPVGPLKSIEWKFPDGTTTTDYNLLRNNMTAGDNGYLLNKNGNAFRDVSYAKL